MRRPSMLIPLVAVFLGLNAFAVINANGQSIPSLTKATKQRIMDRVTREISTGYIDSLKALRIVEHMSKNARGYDYNTIERPGVFADRLGADLREFSGDRHFDVLYSPPDPTGQEADSAAVAAEATRAINAKNVGFVQLRHLPGNIGYLRFDEFHRPDLFQPKALAAIAFLGDCADIVIDLRWNGGGSPVSDQFMASCFLPSGTTLSEVHQRNGRVTKFLSLDSIPGKRLEKVGLYILTSKTTFSAAEAFTYDLQALQRAVVVGDTTGGGANPVRTIDLGEGFTLYLPHARAYSPITKGNWEGTGVLPDTPCEAGDALIACLEEIADAEQEPGRKARLNRLLFFERASAKPIVLSAEMMNEFTGSYAGGRRRIFHEGGEMWSQRIDGDPFRLVPLEKDLFGFEDGDGTVQFERGEAGRVVSIVFDVEGLGTMRVNKDR